MTPNNRVDLARSVAFTIFAVLVLMLGWDPPLIGPLAGLNFDWSHWNSSDVRPMLGLADWPCDAHNKLLQAVAISLENATGPESLAFDGSGGGPYTGVTDGRILKWEEKQRKWITFGVTSPLRTEELCDRHPSSVDNEHICGRPLGLRFDKHGNLYVADAYFGLVVIGPEGGVARAVSTQAEGVPFRFVNDLDFDENGTVYFTDSSARRPRRECNLVTFEQDRSGRVLKYDPKTQQTTVVARDLFYPNGIAVSQDSSFLLLSYTSKSRIMKLWLKGPKSHEMEEFAELPGFPDNIRRTVTTTSTSSTTTKASSSAASSSTSSGEDYFWVALHSRVSKLQYFFARNWLLLRLLYCLPLRFRHISALTTSPPDAMVVKLNARGEAVEAFEDRAGLHASFLSYVEERDGVLWMSSVYLPKIWALPLNGSDGVLPRLFRDF